METLSGLKNGILKLVPPPKVTKESLLGFTFGIRPFRKGGIRLEREDIKDKVVYHNYGHGGAGVSLGYGASKLIVGKFVSELGNQVSRVAIIGSGYMGLFQSIMLADLGFDVNVYTHQTPVKLGVYKEGGLPMITSQVAGGLWMPYGYDLANKPLHNLMAVETLKYYNQCIQNKSYKGLQPKVCVCMDIKSPVEEFSAGTLKNTPVKVDFGNGVLHDAEYYPTVLMDGDTFLNELYEEAQKKGVRFYNQEFKKLDDVLALKEKVIFNCSGSSSRYIFNDQNLVPYSGHLIYVDKIKGFDYFLSSCSADGKHRVTTYPQGNKLAIGLSYENEGWISKPNMKTIEGLMENINDFIKRKVEIKPKL